MVSKEELKIKETLKKVSVSKLMPNKILLGLSVPII